MARYNCTGIDYSLRPWRVAARIMPGDTGRLVELTVNSSGTVYMNAGTVSVTINASGGGAPEWNLDPSAKVWRLRLEPLYPLAAAIDSGLMKLADEAAAGDDPGAGPVICVYFSEDEIEVSLWFDGYSDDHIAVRLPVVGE